MTRVLQVLLFCGLVSACGDEPPVLVPEAGEYVIGVLPDTQHYAARCPEVFAAQASWLADVTPSLGLEFVAHLGDLTDDGNEGQWQVASDSMAALDGVVPYSVLPGNHDLGVDGDARDRESELDEWFPISRFGASLVETFPEGSMANSFHRVTTSIGTDVCILALEFGPRQQTVDWADAMLSAASECETVFSTHAYLHDNGERYEAERGQPYHPDDYGIADGEDVYDGEELFQALVLPHSQIRMVLSGHALGGGVARKVDVREDGTQVVQMLSNYQERGPCGGDGFLRLIAVSPDGLRVRTYSPTENVLLDDDANSFDLDTGSL